MITINLYEPARARAYSRKRSKGREAEARWKAAHPGRPAELARARRAANPDRDAEYQRRYREAHRDALRAAERERDRARSKAPARRAQKEASRQRRLKDPEFRARKLEHSRREAELHPTRRRDRSLRFYYGLTHAQYEEMFEAQGKACAVCGATTNTQRRRSFPVDHDHDTGAVRAILCSACNSALGYAGDSSERLRRLADYLAKHGK